VRNDCVGRLSAALWAGTFPFGFGQEERLKGEHTNIYLNSFVLTFANYILSEHVLSIGLNPEHEKYREQHRKDMHDILRKSYEKVGGYCGHKPGSKEESDAIHSDISNPNHVIKATRRNGKITSVHLYKKHHGRKAIGVATETEQGKKDVRKNFHDDHKMKRAWGEFSGAPEHLQRKMGAPVIHNSHAAKLTGKQIDHLHPDQEHYTRKIGGHSHEKVIMGHPKED
jgi:hypothetical protein